MIYFRLCCSDYDLRLIKKSHTLNFYSLFLLLVTVIAQFTVKTTNLEKAIYFLSLTSCSINKLKSGRPTTPSQPCPPLSLWPCNQVCRCRKMEKFLSHSHDVRGRELQQVSVTRKGLDTYQYCTSSTMMLLFVVAISRQIQAFAFPWR